MKLLTSYFRNFRSVNHRLSKLLAKKERAVVLDILDVHIKTKDVFMYVELHIRCKNLVFLSINRTKFPILTDQKTIRVSIPISSSTKITVKGIGCFNSKRRKLSFNGSGSFKTPYFTGKRVRELSLQKQELGFSWTEPFNIRVRELSLQKQELGFSRTEPFNIKEWLTKPTPGVLYEKSLSFHRKGEINFNLNTQSVLDELANSTTHEK